jgi:hypothetical protein
MPLSPPEKIHTMTLADLLNVLTELEETHDGSTPVHACCGHCYNGKTLGDIHSVRATDTHYTKETVIVIET